MDTDDRTAATYCARHPRTETRISCVQCGTAICPACMVAAPVGFKCPGCARQAAPARALGRPDQYTKAVVFGVGASAVGAFVLQQVFTFGFLSWIASGVAGYAIAEAVRRGAEGNRADPFRYLAFGLAVAAVAGAWVLAAGGDVSLAAEHIGRRPLALVTFLAAVYGAYRSTG